MLLFTPKGGPVQDQFKYPLSNIKYAPLNAIFCYHHCCVQVAQNQCHPGHYHHKSQQQVYPTSPSIGHSIIQALRLLYAMYADGDCMSN